MSGMGSSEYDSISVIGRACSKVRTKLNKKRLIGRLLVWNDS
jgi:hypothetical protein